MVTQVEIDDILSGRLGEGQKLDFKAEVSPVNKDKKSDLIDDAVAFLNASGGRLLVGFRENPKTGYVTLTPVEGDADKICMQIQQVLKTNISPVPRDLTVNALPVDGGSVIAIEIAENFNKPYCNRITGRYLQRQGRKNEPLMPGEVKALSDTKDRLIKGVSEHSREQLAALRDEGFFEPDHPYLYLSLMPFRILDETAAQFNASPDRYSKKGMAAPRGTFQPFVRVSDGYEVSSADWHGNKTTRFFVSDDWFLQTVIRRPFHIDEGEGRLNLTAMKMELSSHFKDVAAFLADEGLNGPFAVEGAIHNLHSRESTKKFFPRVRSVPFQKASLSETFDPDALVEQIYQRVYESSFYGG